MKTQLNTYDEIIEAHRDGHTVHWHTDKSTLMRTNSGYFNVHTSMGKGKYKMTHLPTLIKKLGTEGFYIKGKDTP
jgi:hypothetical protein